MAKRLKIFSRLLGAWLFVGVWWGSYFLDPFMPHTNMIRISILFMSVFAVVFIFLAVSEWRKYKKSAIIFFKALLEIFIYLSIASLIIRSIRGNPNLFADFFARQASFLLNLFGLTATAKEGILFYSYKKIYFDAIKSGLYLMIGYFVVFAFFIVFSKLLGRKKALVLGLALLGHYLYLIVRLLYVTWIAPTSEVYVGMEAFNKFFWWGSLVSFLPIILLWYFISIKFQLDIIDFKLPSIKVLKAGAIFLLSIFLLAFIFSLFKSENLDGPATIIIDEIHSRWESTLEDFKIDTPEPLAENNYHLFLSYISRFYKVYIITGQDKKPAVENVEIVDTKIIDEKLLERLPKNTILILKCITKPFRDDEVSAILDFVRKGGGLFLIGDHTDCYFMNTNLNKLSKNFGIEYRSDAVYMASQGGWIITDNNDYILHPATKNLGTFLWATGDSLKVSFSARTLIYSPMGSFADPVNYFNDQFFGNLMIDSSDAFGSFSVAAAARYGDGRVIAFTDSTCFNNYLIFTMGRRQMIHNFFKWLGRYRGDEALPVLPMPDQILFDASHNPSHCVTIGNSQDFMGEGSYEGLYYDIGRFGVFPDVNYKKVLSERLLHNYSALVLVSPQSNFAKKEVVSIERFVKNGGGLILIEGPNVKSTINQIAECFGIRFRKDTYLGWKLADSGLVSPAYVEGGEPLFLFKGEFPVVTYKKYGNGLVIAIGDDNLLVNKNQNIDLEKKKSLELSLIGALLYKDENKLKGIDWSILIEKQTEPSASAATTPH